MCHVWFFCFCFCWPDLQYPISPFPRSQWSLLKFFLFCHFCAPELCSLSGLHLWFILVLQTLHKRGTLCHPHLSSSFTLKLLVMWCIHGVFSFYDACVCVLGWGGCFKSMAMTVVACSVISSRPIAGALFYRFAMDIHTGYLYRFVSGQFIGAIKIEIPMAEGCKK